MRAAVRGVVRQQPVLVAAAVAAAVSCFLVPPSRAYADYIDVRTLLSLFATMAVIRALDDLHVLGAIAARLVKVMRTRRAVVLALVGLTMAAAMVVTNDMALLTLLPLAWKVLRDTGNERSAAFVFVMQAAAANLGGMITPFGSPHNLFLFQRYDIGLVEFGQVMAIPFVLSVVLVVVPCLWVGNEPIRPEVTHHRVEVGPVLVQVALFAVALGVVLRVLPLWAALVVPVVLLVVDRRALRRVDYGLLATFVAFFVFSGNLSRYPPVSDALRSLLSDHVMLWSAGASQIISNVPTAILFSHFTDDWRPLLVGVNVGGVGTIVASLASVIALRQYEYHRPGGTGEFLRWFTLVNTVLLVVLVAVMQAVFSLGVL